MRVAWLHLYNQHAFINEPEASIVTFHTSTVGPSHKLRRARASGGVRVLWGMDCIACCTRTQLALHGVTAIQGRFRLLKASRSLHAHFHTYHGRR